MTKPKRKVNKVKAWVIIDKSGYLGDKDGLMKWWQGREKSCEFLQYEVFFTKRDATSASKEWKNSGYKVEVVPCEITYSLPNPK